MDNQSELTNFNNKLILPKTIIKIFIKITINNYLNTKHKKYITLSISNCINLKTINNLKKQWLINIKIILRSILIIKYRYHIVKSIMRENQTIITKHHLPIQQQNSLFSYYYVSYITSSII